MKTILFLICLAITQSGFGAPPAGYTLVFDQEFNNPAAKLSIPGGTGWGPGGTTTFICHTPSSTDFGSSYFSGPVDAKDGISPFRFDASGRLRIKAWFDSTASHWRSGLLSTMGTTGAGFSQANGYYQTAVWIPRAGGTWPSFWMETTNTFTKARTTNAVEIDVFEIYGDQTFHNPAQIGFTGIAHQNVHYWTPAGKNIGGDTTAGRLTDFDTGMTVDFASGWHEFGCLIVGDTITFDIDNVATFTTSMPPDGINQPFYMMIDLAMGGGWPIDDMPAPSPNADPQCSNHPQEMAVSYLRCYAPPAVPSPTPTPTPTPSPSP